MFSWLQSLQKYWGVCISNFYGNSCEKAVLFGSFAKRTYDRDSYVNLSIFSDYFENTARVKGTTYLLIQSQAFEINLEPVAFTGKEYDDRLGIVDEIIKTGIDVQKII